MVVVAGVVGEAGEVVVMATTSSVAVDMAVEMEAIEIGVVAAAAVVVVVVEVEVEVAVVAAGELVGAVSAWRSRASFPTF